MGRSVFNIGITDDFDGYDTRIRYAEQNGATIGLLVVGVCMENDLRVYPQVAEPSAKISLQRVQSSSNAHKFPRSLKLWLHENSAAYFFVSSAVHQTPRLAEAAAKLGFLVPNLDHLRYGVSDEDISNGVLESSAERLAKLVEGRESIFLIIPSRRLWVGSDASRHEYSRFHDRFVANLRQRGLTVVNPRQRFERDGNPLGYHFTNDGHWNKEGHRIAAEEISETIMRRAQPSTSMP